jgi:hypothetical protein
MFGREADAAVGDSSVQLISASFAAALRLERLNMDRYEPVVFRLNAMATPLLSPVGCDSWCFVPRSNIRGIHLAVCRFILQNMLRALKDCLTSIHVNSGRSRD